MYTPLKRNSNNLSNLTTSYSLQALEEPKTLLEDFLAFRQTTRTTAEAYTKALKVFFSFLNERGISAPTEADLLAYRETLFNKSLQATTIASYINAVKQFFSWAEERGLYRNIARNIKGAKVNNYYHKKDYLSVEQAKSVLSYYSGETLEALRNYALILLALTTGLRVIELSRADKKDIDISAGSKVYIYRAKADKTKATL